MDRKIKYNIKEFASLLMKSPDALAIMNGSKAYPKVYGVVRFYQIADGVLVAVEVYGLPKSYEACRQFVFGFHIHAGDMCDGIAHDPFSHSMGHYNPASCMHPFHAGDMPVLFGNNGYAFSVFLTNRFRLSDVIGKIVIIHKNPDDYITQPSGNAGEKIACGVIEIKIYTYDG